jgi:tetratricopeptide (TPR) repeat protein
VLAVAERQLMRVHRSPLPEEVRSSLISAKDLFQVTLSNVSPFSHPLIHTQALVGLSETQALSGAWSDALFSAQHAMTHIEFLDPPAGSEDARLADHLRDQVHLALGYRYLAGGQLSRASQNFEAVKGHCGPPDVGGMRTPSMFWAKLGEARVRMRRARFAIGEVFRDLDEAQSFMTETDEEAALLSGQAAQCRAEAYLMFGSVDRAEAAFRRVFELAREPQVFGVLHLSEFILAFGGLLLKQGQNERLQVVLEDAVDKASRAGLDDTRRQLGRLRDRASKTGGRQLESEKAPPESS